MYLLTHIFIHYQKVSEKFNKNLYKKVCSGILLSQTSMDYKYTSINRENPNFQQTGSSKTSDLDLFVVLRRVQQPGSYCDG